MFLKGLLFWGVLILVLSALAFAFYKYLTSVARYESRKREIALGAACIVLSAASVLFLPAFLFGAGGSVAKIAESIQESVAEAAGDAFMKEGKSHCRSAVDALMESHAPDPGSSVGQFDTVAVAEKMPQGAGGMPTETELIEEGIESALKFAERDLSRGGTIRRALDSAAADLMNSGLMLEVKDAELKEELDKWVSEMFRPFGDEAKGAFREGEKIDPSMERMFGGVVEATPFEEVTGVPDGAGAWKAVEAGGKISRLLPKFFVFLAAAASLSFLALFAAVMLCLREPEESGERTFEKRNIFEYQQQIFEEMNREKK